MAGGLKVTANYTAASIDREVKQAIDEYFKYVVDVYSRAGRAMVEDARSRTKDFGSSGNGSFGNITWELRSSICCAVYRDGREVFFYGPVLNTGADGVTAAKDYLQELSTGIAGIQLIVVAGKEYARAVEDKNYNVISSTYQLAGDILESFIQGAA